MPDKSGRLADGDRVPARVAAIAAQIGDEAIAWNEHEDGTVVIVFNQKGKRTFERDFEILVPNKVFAKPAIHTNEDAQEAVETLTPARAPKPKKS